MRETIKENWHPVVTGNPIFEPEPTLVVTLGGRGARVAAAAKRSAGRNGTLGHMTFLALDTDREDLHKWEKEGGLRANETMALPPKPGSVGEHLARILQDQNAPERQWLDEALLVKAKTMITADLGRCAVRQLGRLALAVPGSREALKQNLSGKIWELTRNEKHIRIVLPEGLGDISRDISKSVGAAIGEQMGWASDMIVEADVAEPVFMSFMAPLPLYAFEGMGDRQRDYAAGLIHLRTSEPNMMGLHMDKQEWTAVPPIVSNEALELLYGPQAQTREDYRLEQDRREHL